MSTLGAQPVHALSLHYPETGCARADVILTADPVPAEGSRVILTAADLPMTLTVLRSGDDAANRPHAVLVGGLGWETPITGPPPSYQNDAGVRLSTVLRDLARRAKTTALPGGEPIDLTTITDATIGPSWSCPAALPGSYLRVRDALAALHEQGFAPVWRVDPDGVTRWGLRAGTAVTARATIMRRDLGVGLRVVGLDSVAAFLPGGTIDGGAVIRRLVVTETAGTLTAEVWSDARLSFRSRILRIVAEAFPALVYGHARTYRVAAIGGDGRLDLAPPSDAAHLAALPKVEQWALGGAEVTPVVGSLVMVEFRDAMPTRPVIVAYQRARVSTPTNVTVDALAMTLGASASAVVTGSPTTPERFAREGDVYSIGTASGPLTFVSTTQISGPTTGKG